MTILITGGAGFIGSNFILNWLDINNNKDDYAFYLESRISLKNYVKRIVHRVLAYIISKI